MKKCKAANRIHFGWSWRKFLLFFYFNKKKEEEEEEEEVGKKSDVTSSWQLSSAIWFLIGYRWRHRSNEPPTGRPSLVRRFRTNRVLSRPESKVRAPIRCLFFFFSFSFSFFGFKNQTFLFSFRHNPKRRVDWKKNKQTNKQNKQRRRRSEEEEEEEEEEEAPTNENRDIGIITETPHDVAADLGGNRNKRHQK